MSIRKSALALAASAAAGLVLLTASPASAETISNQDLVNRMDGSRLALSGNATGDGAEVLSLRGTAYDSYNTEAWDFDGSWDSNGKTWTGTLMNRAADKCMQPESASPKRGDRMLVRPCNGSDLQKWSMKQEGGSNEAWWMWRPKLNLGVTMAVQNTYPNQYDYLRLDYAQPSMDRQWRLGPNNQPWG